MPDSRSDRRRRAAARAIAEAPLAAGVPEAGSGPLVMKPDGLFRFGDDGSKLISGPFEVVAQTVDEAGEWGLLVRFTNPDAEAESLVIARERIVGEKTEVAAMLARRGLFVYPGKTSALMLNQYLAATIPRTRERARVVACTGWHHLGGEHVFVLPDGPVTTSKISVIFGADLADPPPFKEGGSIGSWRLAIAARCAGNRLLVLSLCVAFAAPLLGILGEPGGGFHLFGHSSTGKTTALRAAASVWGGDGVDGGGAYVRQWRSTSNSLEGLAQAHTDALLVLDEIGTADPEALGEAAYLLANGRGRERLSRDGRMRRVARFRTLFLSSGEVSFAAKLTEAQRHPRAGQERRMIDLSADAGAELGIFEDLHGAATAEAFAQDLRTATAVNYGIAGREFVRHLCDRLADKSGFVDDVSKWVGDLAASMLSHHDGADGQVRAVARRFALLVVAGELATQAGLTGWRSGDAEAALADSFTDWVAARGSIGNREDAQAVQQLRDFIAQYGSSRFEDWREAKAPDGYQGNPASLPPTANAFRPVNRAGWRRWVVAPDETGSWVYFLTAAAMREALSGLDLRQAVKLLVREALIVPDNAGRAMRSVRPPGHPKGRLYQVPGEILGAGVDPG